MTKPLLQLDSVACERDEMPLFQPLNVVFKAGDAVQIAGINGIGKSSLLRCLASLSQQHSGAILWRGEPLKQQLYDYRQQLLFIGHRHGLKASLTPHQNLLWYQQQKGYIEPQAVQQALDQMQLYEDIPCFKLSAGQQRRLALARLLISSATVWLLDEPFTAVDKAGVAQLASLLEQHRNNGGLVIFTTHQDVQMDDVRRLELQL